MQRETYLNSINLKQGTAFPYLVLDVRNDDSYPRNPGFRVMHWHEDLQFIDVLEGMIEVVTLETRVVLHGGEGIFINQNVVHLVKKVDTCRYNSFIFPEQFLKFYPESPAAALVERLVGQEALPIFPIRMEEETAAVRQVLRALFLLEEHKSQLYPYEVLTQLCVLWLALCRVVQLPEAEPERRATGERMTIFLRHIAKHYGEALSLEQLARSAHVSKSECLRCFRASLQTTPYRYLMEYRLSRAAELLRRTDTPVGTIAADVGFRQASHFGKCFREKTGMSPSQYRRQR